jgi:hypothetical protein
MIAPRICPAEPMAGGHDKLCAAEIASAILIFVAS